MALSEEQQNKFFEEMLKTPIAYMAAKASEIDIREVHDALVNNSAFAERFAQLERIGMGAAEEAAWRRAVDGTNSYVISKGAIVRTVGPNGESVPLIEKKYSDKLLETILKAKMPDVYGDKTKVEITGQQVLVAPSPADMETFRAMLDKHRESNP